MAFQAPFKTISGYIFDKDDNIVREDEAADLLNTLSNERDAAQTPCVYDTTHDGLPEDPHYREALWASAPTFCPHCGHPVVVKKWWDVEGIKR